MTCGDSYERALAIVGCGAVVEQFYGPGLKDLQKAGWALIFVDSTAERAQETARRFGTVEALTSVGDVVRKVSHAIIATPPATHYSLCGQLLDAGIHVLCEKPFVLDPDEGRMLVDRAEDAKLKLHVNQSRRWFPASRAAKRLIAEGAIGELTSISSRDGARFNWPAKTSFHSQLGLSRNGILSDQGAHTFDLIGWILDCQLDPMDVEHDGYAGPEMTVRVKFSTGSVRGDSVLTWLVSVPPRIRFLGTMGEMTLDEDCNRVLVRRQGKVLKVGDVDRYATYEAIGIDLLRAFVNGTDHPSVAPARTVLRSVSFLDRAYQIGKAKLPLVTALGAIAL